MTRALLGWLILLLSHAGALAQASGCDTVGAPRVSLLTCWPGQEFFQLEGHTALLIEAPGREPYVVNWGVFDFNSPNFAYRFTKGETDYMAASASLDHFLGFYGAEGRCVSSQRLRMTPAQAWKLVELVDRNLLPENRVYRYNYVLDNCATRPLALIENSLGDTLALGPSAVRAGTFREAMRHYHANYPWYQFGIDLALGSGIDQPITDRKMSFSPMDLHTQMATARLASGEPAVAEQRILTGQPGTDSTLGPTPWWLSPRWVCLLAALVTALSVPLAWPLGVWGKIWITVLYGIFTLAGLLLCFLVFVSVHEATSPNWLLLWLNPLCLIPAVGVWVKKARKLVVSYQILNFVLLIALVVVFITGVQSPNPAFYLLVGADAWCAVSCMLHYRRCGLRRKNQEPS